MMLRRAKTCYFGSKPDGLTLIKGGQPEPIIEQRRQYQNCCRAKLTIAEAVAYSLFYNFWCSLTLSPGLRKEVDFHMKIYYW